MPRNRYGKPSFTSEDFVAFRLFAGLPPPINTTRRIRSRWSSIAERLAWTASCNEFMEEYFNPRYPYARWVDFYREYLVWLEFYKTVRQEKDNDE